MPESTCSCTETTLPAVTVMRFIFAVGGPSGVSGMRSYVPGSRESSNAPF